MALLVLTCLAGCSALPRPPGSVPPTATDALPPGFATTDVFVGLDRPTAVRFGPTGRVWVAEQAGRVKVFDTIPGAEPILTADLSDHVFGRNNRGLLGLAPDPTDAAAAYVLYTFPAPEGVETPVWNDDAINCPDGTTRSCVSTGVLARVAFGSDGSATETVLARGWCHHHGSHAPNDLAFGPDGSLYVAAGEGSVPELPFDDGTWLAEEQRCNAGAFAARAGAEQRSPGEWAGAVVRFAAPDLATVAAADQSTDWLASRAQIVAYGLRNPFRMTFRPDSTELWIGDPGWHTWDEIDIVSDATDGDADDFGWPCREGHGPAQVYEADPRCAPGELDPSEAVQPWLVERTGEPVGTDDGCNTAPSSVSGIAFGPSTWASPYFGALYFADYSRRCLFVALADPDGMPDPSQVGVFWTGPGTPVDLTTGPDNALYVARFEEGVITRISGPEE